MSYKRSSGQVSQTAYSVPQVSSAAAKEPALRHTPVLDLGSVAHNVDQSDDELLCLDFETGLYGYAWTL